MTDGTPTSLHHAADEELMLLVAQGFVREPVTELFRRHNKALFNFIAWLAGGDLREAEDLAQATWVKLMTRCADYRPQASFRTFLFQIGRNSFLDARGSAWNARRGEMPEPPPQDEAELGPEAELALRQDLARVHRVLLSLPHPQREVVVLRFFSEMTLEEIAETVGVGFETAKSRLRYAYQSLRLALEQAP